MGKATIVSGGADGNYQVRLDYGKAAQTARLAAIAARLGELVGLIDQALLNWNMQVYANAPLLADVEAATNDYITASRTTPILPEALKAALNAYTEASKKMADAMRKEAPLKLAWQVLKTEQVQLQKEQAKWSELVLEDTVQAWCADLTEDATGEVATLEIPGESKLVLIAPASPTPAAADGVLTAREVQTSAQVFFNAAILPGWQKFKPTYRRGTITALDTVADTASVALDADPSSAQGLDINHAGSLSAVPVQYMSCNTRAFEVGDKCVVKFKDFDWEQPTVVGFVNNPKSCGVLLLSGVVRVGTVVELPVPVGSPPGTLPVKMLRDFRPTPNCWDYPLKKDPVKSPLTFSDEKALAAAGTLNAGLCPTMWSGYMAQVVAVVMGRGVVVPYSSSWNKCHGVVKDSEGKPWLVEVSAANGVLAMWLPVSAGSTASKVDAESVCVTLFGGVPTGGGFPGVLDLPAALADGRVVRLASVADMADYFACVPHAPHIGWTFGKAQASAYNAVVLLTETEAMGKLFRLDFAITPTVKFATLTLVEQGTITKTIIDDWGTTRGAPLKFEGPDGGLSGVIGKAVPYVTTGLDANSPIFVCHINDELEVIRSGWFDAGGGVSQTFEIGNLHIQAYFAIPYQLATPVYEERVVYQCRTAEGQKIKAYSQQKIITVNSEIIAQWVRPDIYNEVNEPYIETTYKITRFSRAGIMSEFMTHNYLSRDTLVLTDSYPSDAPTVVLKTYETNQNYFNELGGNSGAYTPMDEDPAYPGAIGTIEVFTGYAGNSVYSFFIDYVYSTTEFIPEHQKILWASGVATDVYEPEPLDPQWNHVTDIGNYYIEPAFFAGGNHKHVVAAFKNMIFSDDLTDQVVYPRLQYNFIGYL